jgi:PKD repeat protein
LEVRQDDKKVTNKLTASAGLNTEAIADYTLMSIDISEPAAGTSEMVFDELSLSASDVSVGDSVTVTARVRNIGDAPGNYTANFRVDDAVSKTKQGSLLPGEEQTITFSKSFEAAGVYNLAINELSPTGLSVGAPSGSPPAAAFNYAPSAPTVGTAITFDGSVSNDSDGDITNYEWDLDGDNTTDATGKTVTHTYNSSGSYNVSVTVTDTDGLTNTTTQTVVAAAELGSCSAGVNSENDLRCIEYGQTKTSRIDSTDPANPDVTGFYYEPVTFYGSAGDEVTISLSSEQFDAGVGKLITPSGNTRTNPDGLANPVLGPPYEKTGTVTLDESGEFELRIDHPRVDTRGTYEITINAEGQSTTEDTTPPSVEVVSVQDNVTGIPAVTFNISDNATDIDADNATVAYGEGGFFSEYGSQTRLTHAGGNRYRASLFDVENDTRSLGGIDYRLTVSDTAGNTATYNDTLIVKPVAQQKGRFIGLSVGDGSAAADYDTNLLEDQLASTTFDTGTRIAINKLATKAGVSGGASIGAAAGKLTGLGVGLLFSIPSANPPSQINMDTLGGQPSQTGVFTTDSTYNQSQPVFIALSRSLGVETYSQVRVTIQSEDEDTERVVREYDELAYPSNDESKADVPNGDVLIPTDPISFESEQLDAGEKKEYTINAYLWRDSPDVTPQVGKASQQVTVVGTAEENTTQLRLGVTDAPKTVQAADSFTVTYELVNQGSASTAYTVESTVEHPNVTVTDFSGEIQSSALERAVPSATTNSIDPGATGSVTVEYQVASNTTGAVTLNTTAQDPIGNDSAALTRDVTIQQPAAVPTDPAQRALQITGKSDQNALSQNDVTATITRFNRGQSINNVDITQNDVTAVITLFERS